MNRSAFLTLGGLALLALLILVGCERPDPQETVAEAPTETPTPLPTPSPGPTQPPVQVYVVIAQPTTNPNQPLAGFQGDQSSAQQATATTIEILPTVTPPTTPVPTALPEDYFIGWAWSESLNESQEQVVVDQNGIVLRDRPALDGKSVGIVMGFADVIIVGRQRCGYTPIIVHGRNMLSRTTPQPEVFPPEPVPTELPPFMPTPIPQTNTTDGWAYTDELTILGQTAISGPLGVNLRSDPCQTADNLGFIPAGSNLIIIGFANGEYTPVRVDNDIIQLPYDPLVFATAEADTSLIKSTLQPTSTPTATLEETISPTPEATQTLTETPTPSPNTAP